MFSDLQKKNRKTYYNLCLSCPQGFLKKHITPGSSLDSGFNNNEATSLELEIVQIRGRTVNMIHYTRITMVRAPCNLTIILMTGNLKAHDTNRENTEKNI